MPKKREAAAVIEYRNDTLPRRTVHVTDPATVKVLLDPKRQRLLHQFFEPRSVKEAADALGEVPSKLHYHVRLLEKQGVIRVVDERQVRSNRERIYQVAARRFEIAGELSGVTRAAGGATARIMDRAARYGEAFDDDDEAGASATQAIRELARPMTHAQAKKFWKDVAALLDRLENELPSPKPGAPVYGLHVMFTPLPEEDGR